MAQKLAKFHSIKVPIKRTNDWYLSLMDISHETAYNRFNLDEMIAQNNLKFLGEKDIKHEIIWIKNIILESKTPFVFCHNDFRSMNILIRTGIETESQRLMFCDLENARYGYRGIDFSCIFNEWDRDLSDFLMYWKSLEDKIEPDFEKFPNYPNDSTIKAFIVDYIEESVGIYGKEFLDNPLNSVDRILAEVKLFSLLIKMFVILAYMQLNEGKGGEQFNKIVTLVRIFFIITVIPVYSELGYSEYPLLVNGLLCTEY